METMINSRNLTGTLHPSKHIKLLSPKFWNNLEGMRFGIVPAILTVVTCFRAIAAAFGAFNGAMQVILVGSNSCFYFNNHCRCTNENNFFPGRYYSIN